MTQKGIEKDVNRKSKMSMFRTTETTLLIVYANNYKNEWNKFVRVTELNHKSRIRDKKLDDTWTCNI